MFGILFDTVSRFFFGGTIPEPLTVLIFGISLCGITAGLRFYLDKREKSAKKLLTDMSEIVVVEGI